MALLSVGDGNNIYFEHHAGGKRGLSVLLSHGWGMACRAWDDTTAFLVDQGYDVIAYDQRGCGQSDKDFADHEISALGDDVVALCRHLGLSRVVLNGWSLGGAVVIDAAAKLGKAVAGIVLTSGATPRYTQAEGFPHGGTPEAVEATVAALRAGRAAFLHTLYFEGVFAKPVPEAVKAWCRGLALQASPAADASLRALAHLDQRSIMASLSVPALVFAGDQDGVAAPGIAVAASELLPQGKLVMMEGCGHAPFLEDPERYHRELGEFLAGL